MRLSQQALARGVGWHGSRQSMTQPPTACPPGGAPAVPHSRTRATRAPEPWGSLQWGAGDAAGRQRKACTAPLHSSSISSGGRSSGDATWRAADQTMARVPHHSPGCLRAPAPPSCAPAPRPARDMSQGGRGGDTREGPRWLAGWEAWEAPSTAACRRALAAARAHHERGLAGAAAPHEGGELARAGVEGDAWGRGGGQ